MSEIIIRRMTASDVDGVAAVEAATFPTPWSRDAFASEMKNVAARYLVAEKDGVIIGYAGAWIIIDESHITNIAVAEEARGQGIGKGVTRELMQYASNMGVQYMTLEVRKSNLVAQGLYKKLGFIELGVRKRYYEDNGEDALIMVCDHLPEVDPDFEEEGTIHE